MSTRRTEHVLLAGCGNVGAAFLALVRRTRDHLRDRHGLVVRVVAVVEVDGAVVDPAGIDGPANSRPPAATRELLRRHPGWRAGVGVPEVLADAPVSLYVEATPVDVATGQPALGWIRQALDAGRHVVTANKAPLALAFAPLTEAAARTGAQLRYSACVAGALPVINVGVRDLGAEPVRRFAGVLNGTSLFVLRTLGQGATLAEAVGRAQQLGIAEADPHVDLSGLDAGCKLVIVANAVLGHPCTLADVAITSLYDYPGTADPAEIVLPLATAVRQPDGGVALTVAPQPVPPQHPLARIGPTQMGAVLSTDNVGELTVISDEPSAAPAAAALLRDILDIHRSQR